MNGTQPRRLNSRHKATLHAEGIERAERTTSYSGPLRYRNQANARERDRTHSVNEAYTSLRQLIPTEPADRKLSKIETLRLAASYISHLRNILDYDFCSHARVPVINGSVSALEFYRDWVSSNLPVVFKGSVNDWPAIKAWSQDYLRDTLGDKVVSVAVTPNGYADAIATDFSGSQYFVEPEERQLPLSKFFDILKYPQSQAGVFYIQKQDSNLTSEFPELINDIEPDIPWATEAFGSKPAAVNLWIGDERAITSLHKDPFENIYCVVSGYKDFILLPPTDRPWIPYKKIQPASYKEISPGNFDIIPKSLQLTGSISSELELTNHVPWICIDPLKPDLNNFPLYRNATPIRVRVEAGDVLYLPSLWFHHVQQSHACIAVNYWYDMKFDIKYAYFEFLQSLSEDLQKQSPTQESLF